MILQEPTKNEKDLFLIYSKFEEIQKIRRKRKENDKSERSKVQVKTNRHNRWGNVVHWEIYE